MAYAPDVADRAQPNHSDSGFRNTLKEKLEP